MRVLLKNSKLFLSTGQQPYNKALHQHTPICFFLGGLMQRNTMLDNIFLDQKDIKRG